MLLKFVGRVPTHKPFMAMMIGYCTNVRITLGKRLKLAELIGEWPGPIKHSPRYSKTFTEN